MRIGPYQIANNLILAPMAGVTDRPFRQLCRRLGAGLAVSEMVSSNSALWGSRKTMRRLDFDGEPTPRSVQIVGADPVVMAEAAKVSSANGAQIIDINMGCPAKKVCQVAAGSALLGNEILVAKILRAVVGAVHTPVTLKIRTGWDKNSRNGLRIAQIAEQEGISALAVHGRTRACGFSGAAEHDTVARIKQLVTIPVIANGDIDSPEVALHVLRTTGVDGLMIGRSAQGRPWIFREIAHYIKTGEHLAPPSPAQVSDLLCEHVQCLYRFYGERQGVRVARKHIAWYSKHHRQGSVFRDRINNTDSADEQITLIRNFFVQPGTERGEAA
ncbi:MAG: tRNA dihydrouridine synthase DusB [Gammaproteobacteria bacterium]|nr:tRNA dihydrouridine synthase DusB [Gammaproteobacteria bacterium]